MYHVISHKEYSRRKTVLLRHHRIEVLFIINHKNERIVDEMLAEVTIL